MVKLFLRGGRHFLVAGEGVCFQSSVFLWAIDDLKSTVQRQIEVKASWIPWHMIYSTHSLCIYIWIKSMGSPMIFLPYLPWIWCQSCNPMRDVALDTKDPKNSDYTMESGGKRNLDKANIKHDPKGKLIGTVDNGNHRLLGQARYARVCWGFSRSMIIHFPRLSPCTIKIEPMVRFQGRVTIHPYASSYIPSTFCQMVLNLILLNRFESMFARLSLGAAYIYWCQTRCMHHYDLYAW